MNKKTFFIILLIVLLIIVFVTEIFYRNPLYDTSVDYIEDINQGGFLKYFFYFWSYIFLFAMVGFGILITMIFYPINIFFCYISLFIFILFIMCIFKSIYTSPRPYWDIYLKNLENKNIKDPTECNGEFGNPSGHSLIATFILSLWDLFLISNLFKNMSNLKRKVMKYITLFICIICIGLIIYSRIHRQVHSFNQILFGTLLGLIIYFTFCHVLELNKITPDYFFEILDKSKFIIIPILIVLYALSLVLGLVRHNNNEDEYKVVLAKFCDYKDSEEMFGKKTGYISSLIFIIIGGYIGLLFLKHKINKYHLNREDIFYNWNKYGKINALKIIIFSFILPAIIPLCVHLFVPNSVYALKIVLVNILFFAYGFLAFGLCFYYSCSKINKKSEILENSGERVIVRN